MEINSFPWDGTDLGEYDIDVIVDCVSTILENNNQIFYWRLNSKKSEIVIAKKFKDYHEMIIDEIKPLFGIHKLGTHTIVIDKKRYTIIRPPVIYRDFTLIESQLLMLQNINESGNNLPSHYPYSEFFIFQDIPLTHIDNLNQMPIKFKNQIRRLLIFRYLLSIQTYQSSLYLRPTSFYPKIDSNDEEITIDGYIVTSDYNGFLIKNNLEVIPDILLNQYFNQDKQNDKPLMIDIFADMIMKSIKIFNINIDIEDLSTISFNPSDQLFNAWLLKFTSQIEKIIRRIDKSSLWIINTIVTKIINYKDRYNLILDIPRKISKK